MTKAFQIWAPKPEVKGVTSGWKMVAKFPLPVVATALVEYHYGMEPGSLGGPCTIKLGKGA